MKILVLTFGSTGDVLPFIAIGKGLKQNGHSVSICTAARFESLITSHGLGYGHMTDELLKLIDTNEGRTAIEDTVGFAGTFKTMIRLVKKTKPITRQMMTDSWAAARQEEPDLIIYHPKAVAGVSIAEKMNIPVIMATLQPMMVPTNEFPLLIFKNLPFGKWLNRSSYQLIKLGNLAYNGLINRFRAEELGLGPFSHSSVTLTTRDNQPIRVIHGFSAHMVPRPRDWPDAATVNGYWFLDRDDEYEPSDQLSAFLDTKTPVVYFGFGSMAGKNPERLGKLIIRAVEETGVKAIVATGWGGIRAQELPDSILPIKEAPHDWLFPRVTAVVHHGGAGTTAAGLRAGKPTFICPFIADQPFWGQRVYDLGAGAKPVMQKKLTLKKLAAALNTITTDVNMAEKARYMGTCFDKENGVAQTVDAIEAFTRQGA